LGAKPFLFFQREKSTGLPKEKNDALAALMHLHGKRLKERKTTVQIRAAPFALPWAAPEYVHYLKIVQ